MRVQIFRVLIVLLGMVPIIPRASAQAPAQITFATPDEAAKAAMQGFTTNDIEKLKAAFGSNAAELLGSGDPVSDRNDREVIGLAMRQTWRWVPRGANKKELVIGAEGWPFPVPLVKKGTGWQFDSSAGQEEVLARRIGRNELNVIDLCRAYVLMQRQYAGQPHDDKLAGLYAQKVRSTPGRHDGLYWDAKPEEEPSPLGDLAAEAAAEGYDREKSPMAPFMGYYFRILTAQGNAAPGGAKNYVVNGDMSGGFALLAYPAKYAYSGVMTFIVNQSAVVYQKDLGDETPKLAPDIKAYNPDKSWTKVHP